MIFWFVAQCLNQQPLNIMRVCLYSCLVYPVCQSDLFSSVLHCHVWPVWQYHIFVHDIINGTIFEKKNIYLT